MSGTLVVHTGGTAAAAACSPQVICVGPNGQFQTITDAIASITDESPTKQYEIRISPGVYVEDIVLRRWINLHGCGFGPDLSTVITGTGPTTVQVPQGDVVISGIAMQIVSATATDAALRVVDDGDPTPTVNPPFMRDAVSQARGGARATSVEAGGLITIIGGHDAWDLGVALHLENAIYFHIGAGGVGVASDGVSPGSIRGIEEIDGMVLLTGNPAIAADENAGTAIYCESVAAPCQLLVEEAAITDAFNGVELAGAGPGGNALLGGLAVRGGIGGGTPLSVAVNWTAFVTPETRLNNGGDTPLQGWVVNGSVVRQPDATWGMGNAQAAGPDQRPAAAYEGYQYWAQDTAIGGGAGTGVLLTYNGLGQWIDSAGNVVP